MALLHAMDLDRLIAIALSANDEEAAGELADPRLIPALERLREAGWAASDPLGGILETAIGACRSGKPVSRDA